MRDCTPEMAMAAPQAYPLAKNTDILGIVKVKQAQIEILEKVIYGNIFYQKS